jgi:glycosyltransferase involved in cell wall biosynthesis
MKVIHFIAGLDKTGGGTTEYMRLLGTALAKTTDIIIVSGRSKNPICIEGIEVKFFNTKITAWFSMLKAFKVFLKEEQPDLVHINGIWNPQNWGFHKTAQELGIKIILSPHGMLEPWILAHNPWKKKLALFIYQRKAICRANYLVATAEMEKDNILQLGFSNPISIIPNGIDLSEVKKVKTVYGTKKIVFLSRIHPKKGIELLLEAWRNIDTKGWTLEIAGNGEEAYIEILTQIALDLKNVHFVGPQYGEAKWDFLRSADVMVLPTYSENFGIVVAEALAVGVPVITTKGTPWEDLETYQCGWWIELSIEKLKEALLEVLIISSDDLKDMGFRGRDLIITNYSITNIAKCMSDFYLSVYNDKNIIGMSK